MTAYFFSNSAIIKRQLSCLRMMIMMRQKQSLVLLAVTKTASIFLRSFWTPLMFSSARRKTKKSSGTSSINPRTRGSAALPFMRKISHPSLFFVLSGRRARMVELRVCAFTVPYAPGLPTRFCTRRHLTFSPPLGYNKFYGTRPLLKRNTEV